MSYSIPPKIRKAVIERDGEACRYCGCIMVVPWKPITIDHLIPRSKGGTNELSNLVVSCGACNDSKGVMTLEESGRVLFPPQFFGDTIAQARRYLHQQGRSVEFVACPHCGETFDSWTTYSGSFSSVRRSFCCNEHAVAYTMVKTAERLDRKRIHAIKHPNDVNQD